MSTTNINNLPSKTELQASDKMVVQDEFETYNTPVGNLKRLFNVADGLTVENNKLYLTCNGTTIGPGISISQSGEIEPSGVTSIEWNEF